MLRKPIQPGIILALIIFLAGLGMSLVYLLKGLIEGNWWQVFAYLILSCAAIVTLSNLSFSPAQKEGTSCTRLSELWQHKRFLIITTLGGLITCYIILYFSLEWGYRAGYIGGNPRLNNFNYMSTSALGGGLFLSQIKARLKNHQKLRKVLSFIIPILYLAGLFLSIFYSANQMEG